MYCFTLLGRARAAITARHFYACRPATAPHRPAAANPAGMKVEARLPYQG
jgi:hypothetical protein